ncbi:ATP-binding cassette domain-containing protein [Rhodobacter capsulatus]|uniref:ATP-binding cassette domain-containing protein n=1 Tax=Rhodobacter capsulatus TaxID=1061 RepID=UPI0040387642
MIVVRLSEPLSTFILYTAMLEVMEAALERIGALLALAPLPQRAPAAMPDRHDIRFEAVSFTHARAGAPTIRAFSALLPEHSLTALVGPSGCGKTTLTRLLLRHFDPQEGAVQIGGIDLRQIPAERLNDLISVVFQDVYLFNDTVLANIRMGRPTRPRPRCGRRRRRRNALNSSSGCRRAGRRPGRDRRQAFGRRASAHLDRAGAAQGCADRRSG